MTPVRDVIFWYGEPPLPGTEKKIAERGYRIIKNPGGDALNNYLLGQTRAVIFDHGDGTSNAPAGGYLHLPIFVDHGAPVLVVASNKATWAGIRQQYIIPHSETFLWDKVLKFMPNWAGVHFDNLVGPAPDPGWHHCEVILREGAEKLVPDEQLLVCRAFQKAEQVHLREIPRGFSGSRVFMAYEKRRDNETSIAHWAQPRLVKIGVRKKIEREIGAMLAVSPFIPFDLRPNLDVHVLGFRNGVIVADFIERSESLLETSRDGRAEAALSNLFNRTMRRWRERGWQRKPSPEPLADAAARLGIVSPGSVLPDYIRGAAAEGHFIDIYDLWERLRAITFEHRVATIHGDLHGDNVRIRGDDAVLIDLGSVRGDDKDGGGAPLCFDVAMLEVALVFTCTRSEKEGAFAQSEWRSEIDHCYRDDVIRKALEASEAPQDGGWMLGCLQRIRAVGIYEQSDDDEYALALAIAMLRMCRFEGRGDADRGRRTYGLIIAARIINTIHAKRMS